MFPDGRMLNVWGVRHEQPICLTSTHSYITKTVGTHRVIHQTMHNRVTMLSILHQTISPLWGMFKGMPLKGLRARHQTLIESYTESHFASFSLKCFILHCRVAWNRQKYVHCNHTFCVTYWTFSCILSAWFASPCKFKYFPITTECCHSPIRSYVLPLVTSHCCISSNILK